MLKKLENLGIPNINPEIDYLTRDYNGFRRLLIDQLKLLMPNWNGEHPADFTTVLIEILAYAADQLCYYQDSVATEAYLRTARQRISVKRHARLMDYNLHEGCNARVWIKLKVKQDSLLPAGTIFLTELSSYKNKVCLSEAEYKQISTFNDTEVFKSLYEVNLYQNYNEIPIHVCANMDKCLNKGSTCVYLENISDPQKVPNKFLVKGDVILLQGINTDNNYMDYHIARVSGVQRGECVQTEECKSSKKNIFKVELYPEDALPFNLQIVDSLGKIRGHVCGNLVLADHGRPIINESLLVEQTLESGIHRYYVKQNPITYCSTYDIKKYKDQAACFSLQQDPTQTLPEIELTMGTTIQSKWQVRSTLLDSHRLAQHFVLEVEENRRAYIRFGKDGLGMSPPAGFDFSANYRIGNGARGNIGCMAISHVVIQNEAITEVVNPLPASGGIDPETLAQVKRFAPCAFYHQRRAVNLADYCNLLREHPMVKSTAACRVWNGSWPIIKIAVLRKNNLPFDRAFRKVLEDYLTGVCMIGDEIHIVPPHYVPLEVELHIYIDTNYTEAQITEKLESAFSEQVFPDGTKGFFHPDNFDFAQPVYFSTLIVHAMQVPGVIAVNNQKGKFCRISDAKTINQSIIINAMDIACIGKGGNIEFKFSESITDA